MSQAAKDVNIFVMKLFRKAPKVLGKRTDDGNKVIFGKPLARFCAP